MYSQRLPPLHWRLVRWPFQPAQPQPMRSVTGTETIVGMLTPAITTAIGMVGADMNGKSGAPGSSAENGKNAGTVMLTVDGIGAGGPVMPTLAMAVVQFGSTSNCSNCAA